MIQLETFKEPKGFIKVIQIVFAILAFSTTCGYHSQLSVQVLCKNETKAKTEAQVFDISYPFDNMIYLIPKTECSGTIAALSVSDNVSKSQYFVGIGVMAFLYSLALIAVYIVLADSYSTKNVYPVADLAGTCFFVFMFFAASVAWCSGVSNLKGSTSHSTFDKMRQGSDEYTFDVKEPKFASLTISLVVGFFNVILWAANAWFVYKETDFHLANVDTMMPQDQPKQVVPKNIVEA